MNPNQAEHVRPNVVDLRSRLQDVKSRLHTVASSGNVETSTRENLDAAIRSIEAVSQDLAAVFEWQSGDPVDRAFLESRAKEAKSEVDSGEFDMHG